VKHFEGPPVGPSKDEGRLRKHVARRLQRSAQVAKDLGLPTSDKYDLPSVLGEPGVAPKPGSMDQPTTRQRPSVESPDDEDRNPK
jgi:hypothetical protein